ncbi:MAG: ABC transporter ATP-binding protein [Oscillospiraceae bacterium]|jgi:branched-chain amino acid transport system ATP-binding protein
MLLETKHLTKRFGGLTVMNDINLTLNEGEILGLIGPNGAGKTTFFNLVTGVLFPNSGRIYYNGQDITRKRPYDVARLGIGRTFQLNPLFGDFTVFENVVAAHHLHPHSSVLDVFFNTKKYKENEKYIAESSDKILEMLGLSHVRNEYAKNLPHGYQKILGVARAIATQPKLLMLDEPLGGMNPEEIDFTLNVIRKLRDNGMTILIVEHNMQILSLCDRVFVISFGEKIFEGTPDEVRNDENVIKTYFGGVAV